MVPTSNIAAFDTEIMAQIERLCTRCYFAENLAVHLVLHTSRQLCPCPTCQQCCVDQLLRHEVPKTDQLYSSTRRKNDECLSGGYKNYNHQVGADTYRNQQLANRDCRIVLSLVFQCCVRLEALLVAFCESAVRWKLFHWVCNYQLRKKCLLHRLEPEKTWILTPVVRVST